MSVHPLQRRPRKYRSLRHRHPTLERPRLPARRPLLGQVRDIGRMAMYILIGATIGMGAFALLDSSRPPESQSRDGVYALRGAYYSNCRDAFLDGRANIRRNEPGYRASLDADNDGLACEPYSR